VIDVSIESSNQLRHEPHVLNSLLARQSEFCKRLHGKSLKIAPRQSRNIWLGQTKQDCLLDLFQSTLADDFVDPSDQTRLDEVSVRIR